MLSQNEPLPTIRVVYTTNLNGALDDCQCGGRIVGGVNRIAALIKDLQATYPDLLLLDGGDFLTSYSDLQINRAMVRLLSILSYDAVNVGDQEFVESPGFFFSEGPGPVAAQPLATVNLRLKKFPGQLLGKIQRIQHPQTATTIIGLTDPHTFEFVDRAGLTFTDPDAVLRDLSSQQGQLGDLQIVLFHGRWAEAKRLAESFPWIDVMLIAHNQRKEFQVVGATALVEAGTEGEYLGFLKVFRQGNGWTFENKFLPIYREVPIDQEAQKIVDQYYRKLEGSAQ